MKTFKFWRVVNDISNRQKKDSYFSHRPDVNQKSYTKPVDIVKIQVMLYS